VQVVRDSVGAFERRRQVIKALHNPPPAVKTLDVSVANTLDVNDGP
jgi:hypothetical protein